MPFDPYKFDTKDLAQQISKKGTPTASEEKAAYNLLVFLRFMGFAKETGETRRAPGKERGKGTTLYKIDPNVTPLGIWTYITQTQMAPAAEG